MDLESDSLVTITITINKKKKKESYFTERTKHKIYHALHYFHKSYDLNRIKVVHVYLNSILPHLTMLF